MFAEKFQKALMPLGEFLAKQRHLSAVSRGLMAALPLSIIGAFSQIIANPPITQDVMNKGGWAATIFGGWFNFAQSNREILTAPFNMTMGLFSVVVSFTIAYQLAKSYDMSALSSGIISMVMFLMVTAPIKNYTLEGGESFTGINSSLLGASGMFVAILIALSSVGLTRLCQRYNLTINLPKSVPPVLAESFNAMVPLLINVLVIYGFNVLCLSFVKVGAPELFISLLMAPLNVANSIPGILFLIPLATLLWVLGIHGTMIIFPVVVPFMLEFVAKNSELIASGQSPEFSPVMLFSSLAMVGGTGNTLGLVLLSLRSKSEQIKAMGKIGIAPAFFGINEPVIFGMPIMFNPILAIPFVLSPIVISLFMLLGFKIGLLSPLFILLMTAMPLGVGGLISSMHLGNFIFEWLMVPVTVVLYYPFFKIYEKQLMKKEELQRLEEEKNSQLISK